MVPATFGGNADLVAARMTRNPQTIGPQSDLAEVSEKMRKERPVIAIASVRRCKLP